MKCLKIENGCGYYSIDSNVWREIHKITKEELLQLLNTGLKEGFDMDDIDEWELSPLLVLCYPMSHFFVRDLLQRCRNNGLNCASYF